MKPQIKNLAKLIDKARTIIKPERKPIAFSNPAAKSRVAAESNVNTTVLTTRQYIPSLFVPAVPRNLLFLSMRFLTNVEPWFSFYLFQNSNEIFP